VWLVIEKKTKGKNDEIWRQLQKGKNGGQKARTQNSGVR
jgi:hypothetical protein